MDRKNEGIGSLTGLVAGAAIGAKVGAHIGIAVGGLLLCQDLAQIKMGHFPQ